MDVVQTLKDSENLLKILERKAESAVRGENEAHKDYLKLKQTWRSENGNIKLQK